MFKTFVHVDSTLLMGVARGRPVQGTPVKNYIIGDLQLDSPKWPKTSFGARGGTRELLGKYQHIKERIVALYCSSPS